MKKDNIYTLITGGSMGIGQAFAHECARRGMNLILVALPGRELKETAADIENKYNVLVHTLEIDLTEKEAPEMVYNWCTEHGFKINILINNAGIAGTAIFEDSPVEYTDLRIQLNIRALVLLTRYFIPHMKQFDKAYILNISSLSAFYAIPFKSIYSASKAFVLSFSKSLREELRNSPVRVSVVCPNGVHTNNGTFERIKSHGIMGKLTQIDRIKLAEYSLNQMFRGKTVIIPKGINRILLTIGHLTPGPLKQRLLKREFHKEIIANQKIEKL